MLENKLGMINISKLRVILFLEADFNTIKKILFNARLILQTEQYNSILKEIIGN